jgi:hypothetical protein
MAMKIASFLRCGVVIVLSLVAGRAAAQIDSNAMVTFSCSPIFGYCSMTIYHGSGSPFDTNYICCTLNPDIDLSYNGSFKFSGGDSVLFDTGYSSSFAGGYCSGPRSFAAQFKVDTINKCFRNLVLSGSCSWGANQGPWYTPESCGFNQLVAQLDSLPYKDSSGILFTHGVFSLSSTHTASLNCANGGQYWFGNCGDTEQMMDTITIEIVPNGYLSVSQSTSILGTRSFAIQDQGSESLLATFAPYENPRSLEIYDLLGRIAALISIPSNAEFIELLAESFPPGCYFARLGNQVAKFVVPPR